MAIPGSRAPARPGAQALSRRLAAATVTGVAAGLGAGVLARLAMRAVALLRGESPELSVGGTIGILLVFVLMGLALSTGVAITSRSGPGGRWRRPLGWIAAAGTVFGLILLITPLRTELTSRTAYIGLFGPAVVVLGSVPAFLVGPLSARLPASRALALPALAGAVLLPMLLLLGVLQLAGVIAVPSE